jgi:hypothetical protein
MPHGTRPHARGGAPPKRATQLDWVRSSGASTGLVVNWQIVINAVASKLSYWIRTSGRGLPVQVPLTAAQ